jgi:GNAT superfamily N-acetyltransferase
VVPESTKGFGERSWSRCGMVAAEQGDEADEPLRGARRDGGASSCVPPLRGGTHRFAAYPRCSADMRCEFAALHQYPPGTLSGLLEESYAPLLRGLSADVAGSLRKEWQAFDDDVHKEPDTLGRCGFLTLAGGELVGFGSWDPRGWPQLGRVGHNCVRPALQRQGHGRLQIERIVEHFRSRGFAVAEARTGADPFFEPARRMYLRCGFELADRAGGVLRSGYGVVVYQMVLGR